tara:strand:+ start:27 stop:491 length:465 start_codon:yes stop_codon:yes gene_type:complete
MLFTREVMQCAWWLKKKYSINHRWAIKIASEILKLKGSWQWLLDKPGSPMLAWEPMNVKRFASYLRSLSRWQSNTEKQRFLEKCAHTLFDALVQRHTVTLRALVPFLGGEIAYLAISYYVASQLQKDTPEIDYLVLGHEDIYMPVPTWGNHSPS